jgi:hypothetical protein
MTAPTSVNYSISPLEGIDYTAVYAVSSSTPELPAAPFLPGTHSLGTNGSEYVFIKASTALAKWQAVSVDLTEAAAVPLTIALNITQPVIGIVQGTAVAAASYGWVAIRGNNIAVLAKKGSLAPNNTSVNPLGKLYVSSTSPGTLTTTSVRTSAYVAGIVLTTSSTSGMAVVASGTVANSISAPVVATATWIRAIF